jgi:hypothetical protein
MMLCIVLDTDDSDGLVFELEGQIEHNPTTVDLKVKEFVGTFPIPPAMVGLMLGISGGFPPAGAPVEAATRPAHP